MIGNIDITGIKVSVIIIAEIDMNANNRMTAITAVAGIKANTSMNTVPDNTFIVAVIGKTVINAITA